MLIISQTQFLEEIKAERSKSIILGESLSISKRDEEVKEIDSFEVNEVPIISNEIKLESHVYDEFRKSSLPNIPKELKAVVGALGSLENQSEVAKAFGVSVDTVGTLANDKHSNAEVSEAKVSILHKIKSISEEKIKDCVDFIEIQKGMNNKELLSTAESLSRIHRNVTPPSTPSEGNIQFIFYAPERQNKIEDYEIIDAVN